MKKKYIISSLVNVDETIKMFYVKKKKMFFFQFKNKYYFFHCLITVYHEVHDVYLLSLFNFSRVTKAIYGEIESYIKLISPRFFTKNLYSKD